MIFGQIKMLITILLITGIAGAGMYVMKLRADNATLKANQIKLETAVEEQNKVLEQEIAYMQLQLETMEAGRQAAVTNRRRTKGFSN